MPRVLDPSPRHLLQLADLRDGLRPGVRLDVADHHIDALPPQPVSLLEHVVGLADARREAQVDLQPPPLLPADQVQEKFRLGVQFVSRHAYCFAMPGCLVLAALSTAAAVQTGSAMRNSVISPGRLSHSTLPHRRGR